MMKASPTPEPVYVFDLDGVVTNPHNTRVNDKVLERIVQLLRAGFRVAVNTGRSYEWVEKNLTNYLLNQNDTTIFERYLVSCEKGGEAIVWSDGAFTLRPSRFAIPAEAYRRVQEIYEAHRGRLDCMFWDKTKRTMATLEKDSASDLATFHAQQKILLEYLSEGLKGYEVRIDPTTVATDIESPEAGKYAGAALIYEWAAAGKSPTELLFISFGDSVSDYEMARCFADRGAASTFVYVGQPHTIAHHQGVEMITTQGRYDEGALEFLNSI